MITCEYLMPILTLIAIIGGPIVGVRVARQLEDRKQYQQQRIGILASLLRTSQGTARLSSEHVGALNLIQLMFYGEKDVIDTYKKYIEHLRIPSPPVEQVQECERFFRDRDGHFLELLATLASALRYQFDKKDLENLAYSPQSWADNMMAQNDISKLLIRLLQGEKPLQVSVVSSTHETEESPPAPPA